MTGNGIIDNQGGPVAQGDFLLMGVGLIDTSVVFDRAIVCPSGWTKELGNLRVTTGAGPANYAYCWKIAGAGDVVSAGVDWASPPTVSWSVDGGPTALRAAYWVMMNYGNVNTTTPIQVDGVTTYSAKCTTNCSAPSVTATSASVGSPATLVTMNLYWGADVASTPDASEELRRNKYGSSGSSRGGFLVADKAITATGATSGTTTTLSGSGEPGVAANFLLQH
jgi:hypothetical protein